VNVLRKSIATRSLKAALARSPIQRRQSILRVVTHGDAVKHVALLIATKGDLK